MTSAVSNSTTTTDQLLASLSGSSSSTSATSAADQQSQFLTLLTTQLKNQDPLNPMDNAQMTSQLAQISTVDGINKLNTTITQMMSNQQGSEAYQAANLVGKQVLVDGNRLNLQSGAALGGVDLSGVADHVYVSIYDSAGNQVDQIDLGSQEKGSQMFVWDGKTSDGTQLADGTYTMKVTAAQSSNSVDVSSLEMATVNSVATDNNTVSIDVGRFGLMSMSDVKRIL